LNPLRTTIARTIGVLSLALVIGGLIRAEHYADTKLASRLRQNGRSAQATIARKRATSSGQGRDLCYITYRFQAPQAIAPNAPGAVFSRDVEVPDGFFDTVTEGQTIAVLYDPSDPSASTPEALIRRRRTPA
jgi:hypothetical protein